jgi:hypothetical protein
VGRPRRCQWRELPCQLAKSESANFTWRPRRPESWAHWPCITKNGSESNGDIKRKLNYSSFAVLHSINSSTCRLRIERQNQLTKRKNCRWEKPDQWKSL